MQKFTKNELAWVVEELDRRAELLRIDSGKEEAAGIAAGMMKLRSEQLASIADRLKKALVAGDKRIEIKY